MRFNRRLIVELQTMNALLKLSYGIDTSESRQVHVSATPETTAEARPPLTRRTSDE
jgi:hypothetical protein